jgi:hypothetical protein
MAGCVSEVQPWVRLLAHTNENRKKLDFSASQRLGVESLCRISDGLGNRFACGATLAR